MGLEAATKALLDAGMCRINVISKPVVHHILGITYDKVEAAYVGYVSRRVAS